MRKRNRKDERWRAFSAGGWRRVGFVSLGVLVGLGAVMSNPMTRINVWATIGSTTEGGSLPSGAQIDLNSTKDVQSEVTLTMDASSENGKLNASAAETNPDVAADVVRRTATVGLTNTSGYTVKIRGNSTNLTGASTSNTIPSVTTATTLGQMSNAWGWNGSIGNTVTDCSLAETFKQMTTSDQELGSGGAESSATKKVTMCFGARVDGTKAADTYSNTVTLSVVAQPGKVATFDGITQMQQMTPAICKAADINDTAQLEDVRDGKKYWVTKLLDGNCWMSQNLDFDISASNVTTATSDVTSDWTSGSEYPPTATYEIDTDGLKTDGYSSTTTYSWDLGDYIIIDPTAYIACAKNNTGLSDCPEQFAVIGNRTPSHDSNFYRTYEATYNNAEYDAHYLAGNYYQWNAATAGTGGTITSGNASGSICPKGWKLPDGATRASAATKGTYAFLLQQYGLVPETGDGTTSGTSDVNHKEYDIALSPLFFVRGGFVNPYGAVVAGTPFVYSGQYGYYWTSLASYNVYVTSPRAYTLKFYNDIVQPYDKDNGGLARITGYSVRCLVPTT